MQVTKFSTNKVTPETDSIAWIHCASGNVFFLHFGNFWEFFFVYSIHVWIAEEKFSEMVFKPREKIFFENVMCGCSATTLRWPQKRNWCQRIGGNSVRAEPNCSRPAHNLILKGIVHNFFFYRSNLIFWIVMGCGIADLGRRGL